MVAGQPASDASGSRRRLGAGAHGHQREVLDQRRACEVRPYDGPPLGEQRALPEGLRVVLQRVPENLQHVARMPLACAITLFNPRSMASSKADCCPATMRISAISRIMDDLSFWFGAPVYLRPDTEPRSHRRNDRFMLWKT
jgi:hypothetical protein